MADESQISVLIVDDHEVVRMGLRALLSMEPDLRVVGEAADGEAAYAEAMRARPDVVIMDVRMGHSDGIDACRAIKSDMPGVGVLMLTSFGEREAVLASLMAGASGFLLKNTGHAELLRAIRSIAAGDSLLDPAITRSVMDTLVRLAENTEDPRISQLTEREREVLLLVADGQSNKEIAQTLVISPATARNHVSHILDKLGMRSRSEAAVFAVEAGLREPSAD
jgi:two-component system response regulator DevR